MAPEGMASFHKNSVPRELWNNFVIPHSHIHVYKFAEVCSVISLKSPEVAE